MRLPMSAAVLASTLTRNFSEPSHTKAGLKPILISNPICRLARAGMDLGDASESARHFGNQVELMQLDNVCSPEMPGFGQLGILPHTVEGILQQMLNR